MAESTELVTLTGDVAVRDGGAMAVEAIESMEQGLAPLVRGRDVDGLKAMRAEADFLGLAHSRAGYEAEAIRLLRLSVRAAAEIGLLTVREGPARAVDSSDEGRCRTLAAALDRGHLEAVLDACGSLVSVPKAERTARAMGETGVPRRYVQKAIQKHAAESGTSLGQLSLSIGRDRTHLSGLCAARKEKPRMEWWAARLATEQLGIDITSAPVVRLRPRPRMKAKWETHRIKKTGGNLDQAKVLLAELRDELFALDPGSKRQLMHEAIHTLSDAIIHEDRHCS